MVTVVTRAAISGVTCGPWLLLALTWLLAAFHFGGVREWARWFRALATLLCPEYFAPRCRERQPTCALVSDARPGILKPGVDP